MEKINCFNYELYRAQCDELIYKDTALNQAVNLLLSTVEAKDTDPEERQGSAVSTVGAEHNLLHYSETHNLANWVISQIMDIDEFKSKNSNTFDFTRHWANRIYKDCSGLCHTHTGNPDPDAVAIFYLDVPNDSSDLVVINNGKENSNYLDYDEEDRHHINVQSGTLIIHKPDVPHAVSIHNSTEPRTCLIFEFKIAEGMYEN